jgi:hypothetical protein
MIVCSRLLKATRSEEGDTMTDDRYEGPVPPMPSPEMCACGKPLHYSHPKIQETVQTLIDALGEDVKVTLAGRMYMAPRHYIALHGLAGADLASMNFPDVDHDGKPVHN